MRAVVVTGKELKLVEDYPKPAASSNEALIRVIIAGICNTDLEIIRGYMGFGGVIGHEFVGVVEECDEKEFLGRRVVGEINCGCGKCRWCQEGLKKHCPKRSVLGIQSRNGAFADYLALPIANLHLVPDSVSDEEAVFVEPIAAAMQILEQVEIKPENEVVIIGDGKLGLLVAQVIALCKCHLRVVGHHSSKLGLLKEKGINTCLASQTGGIKAEIVIDCTGHPDGFALAREIVKPTGKIVLKSTFWGESKLSLSSLVIDEITLIGSRCGPFEKALKLLEGKQIDVMPLISGTYPIAEALRAIEDAGFPRSLKVLIKM